MGEYREPEMENRTMNESAATTLNPRLYCRKIATTVRNISSVELQKAVCTMTQQGQAPAVAN